MNPTPEFDFARWFPDAPYATLARPAAIPDHRSFAQWEHLLRFWHYQAVGARVSWSVFADNRSVSGRRAVVRRVTWRMLPSPLAAEAQNEVTIADAYLVLDELDERMKSLVNVPIVPFLRQSHWQVDCETFGIEKPRFFYLAWWSDEPKEWSEFTERVRAFREWLNQRYECKTA